MRIFLALSSYLSSLVSFLVGEYFVDEIISVIVGDFLNFSVDGKKISGSNVPKGKSPSC